jgi:L-lactate dehydrogenase
LASFDPVGLLASRVHRERILFMPTDHLFDANALSAWAQTMLERRGMAPEKAASVAAILVEGDLLGHDTHGLALLGPYLTKLDQGELVGAGSFEIVSDRPAALLWDGRKLPGPWLVLEAIAEAGIRARALGAATVVIRSSGHIACLAAYLEAPAREGLMVEIYSSDPAVCSVAPFGGKTAVFTPNPLAVGIPTSGDPIMIDISTSITTNGMSARLQAAGERFPGKWLLDGQGRPSDDPAVFSEQPRGTIQLLGGTDSGHKGYGLTLTVEAMTGGLAGYGRADAVEGWGATVMVRVTDTAAFAGREAFDRQLDWVADACRENPAIDPKRPVRLPGERGLERKRKALAEGLGLAPTVRSAIERLAIETGVELPR